MYFLNQTPNVSHKGAVHTQKGLNYQFLWWVFLLMRFLLMELAGKHVDG